MFTKDIATIFLGRPVILDTLLLFIGSGCPYKVTEPPKRAYCNMFEYGFWAINFEPKSLPKP